MQTDIVSAAERQRKAALLARAPSWLERCSCALKERPCGKKIDLYYYCPSCSPDKKLPCDTVSLGPTGPEMTDAMKAEKIREKLLNGRHHEHNHSFQAPDLPSEKRMANELKATKRKLTRTECELKCVERKVDQANVAVAAVLQDKKQKTKASNRRKGFDGTESGGFTKANKSTALLSDSTGMLDTLRYWCQGSEDKAVELILAAISSLGLHDRIVAALGLEVNETYKYIVEERLSPAVCAVKGCRTEQQRQEYRLLLNAIAPEKGKRMGERVAAAVGASRTGAPYMDAIESRSVIDGSIKLQGEPLATGDTVLCRHGVGTLLSYSGLDSPCSVEIKHGDHTHISNFKRASKGEGGGRVQRVPITFQCEARAKRCDALHQGLLDKVRAGVKTSLLLTAGCCSPLLTVADCC